LAEGFRTDLGTKSLGEVITRGVLALREGDRDEQQRQSRRLSDALRRFDGAWRGMGVRDEASVDEVRQTLLINLWGAMRRWASGAQVPNDLCGYARQIGANAARDHLNHQSRMRRRLADHAFDDEPVVEASGTFSLQELAARAEEERRAEERSLRVKAHLAEYVREARRVAAVRDPSRMLGIWYALRVQKRAAAALAREHGIAEATVWQTASRGARLLDRLADADPDLARAELMRALAAAA
jgi:hypothetical protein